MVDIVKIMDDQVAKWQEDEKCGYCWQFEAPQRESDMNESVMKTDDCCVRVFLTNYSFSKNRSYGSQNPFHYNTKSITHRFTLYFVLPDRVDINVHREQKDHPDSESKWAEIINPLRKCIGDFDFCKLSTDPMTYRRENWNMVMDFLDMNYTGWRVGYELEEML